MPRLLGHSITYSGQTSHAQYFSVFPLHFHLPRSICLFHLRIPEERQQSPVSIKSPSSTHHGLSTFVPRFPAGYSTCAHSLAEQIRTTVTDLLKINHPVMLAGMNVAAGPKLAAAVTNAGGLGVIGGVV